MALVSSITPPTSLYPGSPSIHARTTPDSSSSPAAAVLVRKLPTPPSPVPNMSSSSPSKASSLSTGQQLRFASTTTTTRTGGATYASSPGHPVRQPQASSGYGPGGVTASAGGDSGGSSPSASPNSVRLPSPLPPPTRSASTPPTASSPSPARPTATPLSSFHHHSSSSSSIPRAQSTNYMAHPQLAHPSFVGQAFSPFAPPHAFAHPAFPFVPSPHPTSSNSSNNNNYVSYSPNGQLTPGATVEQQKRLQAFQQAQWAAAASQMEMLRNQQSDGRKRTTSGPASHQSSPTYYTTPLPYPPSPAPTLHHQQQQQQNASFPPGAMLPHGYPTPPGSVEGVVRGGESGGSSSGGSREGGYHPYRRDPHHHHHHHATTTAKSPSSSAERSATTTRSSSSHSTSPSTSSNVVSSSHHRVPVPKLQVHTREPQQQFPRSHASSPSISSVHSTGANLGSTPSSSSSPSTSSSSTTSSTTASSSSPYSNHAAAYASRPRTQSSNSSSSSLHRTNQYESPSSTSSTSSLSSRTRTASFEQQQQNTRPRPSPLGGVHQPLPVDSDEEEEDDDGVDSDGTAEATVTVNNTAAGGVTRSSTMNSLATIKTSGGGVEKAKEKKGMASRFKKAFGGGGGSSSTTRVNESELDGGRGGSKPGLTRKPRGRSDSVSSSETSTTTTTTTNPRTRPAHHHASQPSIASMASGSTRTINGNGTSGGGGDADSTRKAPSSSRFRLLNSKLNSSTDNISISSTVSSASVMIRKLGQMGKLARRNSLMGLTKAFKKDKNKGTEGEGGDEVTSSFSTKKDKKSGASLASVSHATAEIESSPRSAGMSPAAALAKRQQMHYAEQEAAAAEAEAEAAKLRAQQQQHARTDSSDVASVKSGRSGRWGIGRSKTTDDVSGERANAIEKEKEKLKSRSSKFGRLGFGGGSKTDLHSAADDDANERGGSALGLYHDADTTPRQSLEILAPPPPPSQSYATYGGDAVLRRDSSSDYEPSLYRHGATPTTSQGRVVKGILKGAGTYSQEQYARPRPEFHRIRASSFDAPQQQGRPGSPGGAALVNVIPSQAQVDGVAPSSSSTTTSHATTSSIEQVHDSSSSSVYGNPSMNASAPALTQFGIAASPIRTSNNNNKSQGQRRRIAFAANLSVHTTWPAAIYDRRAEPATCNRLTPTLAQQIKEELNSFKMEEMDVHPESRKLTHFFV